MHRTHGLGRLIGGAVIAAVVLIVYLVLEIADRLTESKAMRARVNDGSEKFFAERGSIWQAATRATRDWISQYLSGRYPW